jgi:hypothetical protein
MSLDLSEFDPVGSLSPQAVAAYLRSKGWADQGKWGQNGRLFARDRENERVEIVLPTKSTLLDYSRRMAELVRELADAQGERPTQILHDLTVAPYDVVRIRAKEADEYASVPLDAGDQLFRVGRDMIITAAVLAGGDGAKPVVRGRRPTEAARYLENVRLGQTERGSFVLTMLSPHSFDLSDQMELLEAHVPFGRRVTSGLAGALRAVEEALQEAVGSGPDAFRAAVQKGVSAKLCSSLARLALIAGGADVSVTWSPQRPNGNEARLSLQREDASVLQDAAASLAEQEGPQRVEVQGTVLGITERKEEFDGTVTLHAVLDGRSRVIRAHFADQDRDKVFEAFHGKTDLQMRIVGELTRESGALQIVTPREFEIVKIQDPSEATSGKETE